MPRGLPLVLLAGAAALVAAQPPGDAVAAAPVTTAAASVTPRVRVMINLPARRLRVHRDGVLVMDVPAAIGMLRHPEGRGDTRTRVGSYRIVGWYPDYRNARYPVRFRDDPWESSFGPWTAKLQPPSGYQHLHGCEGPDELGDGPVELLPTPLLGDETRREYGLSHGCVRLANRSITRLHQLAPAGTPVERFYCLRERRPGEDGAPVLVELPDVYGYAPAAGAVFDVATGALEGYVHPEGAPGPVAAR